MQVSSREWKPGWAFPFSGSCHMPVSVSMVVGGIAREEFLFVGCYDWVLSPGEATVFSALNQFLSLFLLCFRGRNILFQVDESREQSRLSPPWAAPLGGFTWGPLEPRGASQAGSSPWTVHVLGTHLPMAGWVSLEVWQASCILKVTYKLSLWRAERHTEAYAILSF